MKTGRLSIGTFEAKNRFSELIDRAGRGAEITITKHDTPVARIVPAGDAAATARHQAVADLRALRSRYRLDGVRATDLINAGRR